LEDTTSTGSCHDSANFVGSQLSAGTLLGLWVYTLSHTDGRLLWVIVASTTSDELLFIPRGAETERYCGS
jgi:hypothetical protein